MWSILINLFVETFTNFFKPNSPSEMLKGSMKTQVSPWYQQSCSYLQIFLCCFRIRIKHLDRTVLLIIQTLSCWGDLIKRGGGVSSKASLPLNLLKDLSSSPPNRPLWYYCAPSILGPLPIKILYRRLWRQYIIIL